MSGEEQLESVLEVAKLTDVGVVREHNEDAFFVDPEHRFFVVADGMGGHAAGEVASAMAVEAVSAALDQASETITQFVNEQNDSNRKAIIELLEEAVRSAHRQVFERGAQESDKQGMGTTLDVVLIAGAEAFIAHVGDSRTYMFRKGAATQLTTDHTVAEVLMIEGKLSPEEAASSPLRTILVNAIGVAPEVGVEMSHITLESGDRILVCSDGLHDYFPVEDELAEKTRPAKPIEPTLAQLVELAKERGGHDNITGVLIEVVSAPEIRDSIDPFATTLTGQSIPEAVARDETLPVQALGRARTEDGETTEDTDDLPADDDDVEDSDDDESGDDGDGEEDSDDDGDEADEEEIAEADTDEHPPASLGAKQENESDLKQTVPLGPMLKKHRKKSKDKK